MSKRPVHSLLAPRRWHFCALYWGVHCLKGRSAEVQAGMPKGRKVVVSLTQKIPVLGQLHLGMSSSAVGCEVNVNESKTYI